MDVYFQPETDLQIFITKFFYKGVIDKHTHLLVVPKSDVTFRINFDQNAELTTKKH